MSDITSEDLMKEADTLFAYARARVGKSQDAEDLVQEVIVTAWQKRAAFNGRSKLSTWLIGIMKFKVLDHFRKKKRTPTQQSVDAIDSEDGWGKDPLEHLFDGNGAWKADPNYGLEILSKSPEELANRQDVLEWIDTCMKRLPERLRLLFSLREVDGFSVAEAALAAGVTHGSAAVLLTRARHQLRECLQRHQIAP